MGRQSEYLTGNAEAHRKTKTRVVGVIRRAFAILRCFEDQSVELGNRDIVHRCKLPPSTVSRLTLTLTTIGELTYVKERQKYRLPTRPSIESVDGGTDTKAALDISVAHRLGLSQAETL